MIYHDRCPRCRVIRIPTGGGRRGICRGREAYRRMNPEEFLRCWMRIWMKRRGIIVDERKE